MSIDLWFDQMQQDPDGDCEHGVPAHIACEYCEIGRLQKLLAEEEAEGAEMQALLFAIVEKAGLRLSMALPSDIRTQLLTWYRRLQPPTHEE